MRAISLALLLLSARPGSGRLSRRRGSASLFTVHLSQPAVASEVFSALLPSKRADTRGEGEGGLLAACAHLVQAVAVCVVSLALTGEARRLVRSLLPLVGGDRTCAPPMSEELALSLRNATLSALELEMSAALVFPSSIEACAGGQEALAETLAEAAETQDSLGLGAVLGPVRGVLLYGPPGCGKSTLARALSKRLGRPLLALTPSSLLRKYVGDTSQLLRAAFSLAAKLGPCVLLVDEMDALFRARADGDNELDRSLKTECTPSQPPARPSPSNPVQSCSCGTAPRGRCSWWGPPTARRTSTRPSRAGSSARCSSARPTARPGRRYSRRWSRTSASTATPPPP